MFCIENKFLKDVEKLKDKDEKKEFLEKKYLKYHRIQNYLIENSSNLCTIIPCNINNYEETLVKIRFFDEFIIYFVFFRKSFMISS